MIRLRLRSCAITGLLLAAAAVILPSAAPAQDTARDEVPIGSTRNSVAAIPAAQLPDEVVYLTSRMSGDLVDAIARVAPNVRIIGGLDRESALSHAGRAHGIDAHLLTSEFLEASPALRWAQAWSAGVEGYVRIPELRARDEVVLTNLSGVAGPVIAEHVFAMMLAHARNLSGFLDAGRRGEWDRGPAAGMRALQGQTLLVVGMGAIGGEVAVRADAFGMRVLATVRTARPAPPYVDALGTAADLERFLPEADFVVLAVPLTDETRGLIDRDAIARMKDGAWLVNIARGAVVDTEALVEALDAGKIGAALLDVTDPEPLPGGHPLWGRDDVLITPHVAGRAELTGERRQVLLLENMRRFGAGEPLLNVVNKTEGY